MRARSGRQKEARCAGARWPGAVSAPENWKIAKTGKLGVWSQANRNATIPVPPRPLTVSFQFRASGKETDVATPLGLEKYGKVDFTLGKLTKRHPKNGQK